jgi:penicillin-binding protein 1C
MQELRRPDEESNWQRFGSSRPIAWKTGTSYGHKDAWSVGLNAKYVVAVWLGNADGEGRADLVGVSAAAPLMFRVFNFLDGDAQFSAPMGEMKTFRICQQSGFKANEACEATELIYASNSLDKTLRCPYHKYIFLDERQRYQVNASCYPTTKMVRHSWFALPPAQEWYYRRTNAEHLEMPAFKPGCLSDDNQMEMIYPRNFTKVYIPIELNSEQGRVVFEAAHRNPGTKIFWHLDDEFVGTTTSEHKLGLYPPKGNHRLHLVDEFGQELTVNFVVLNESKSGQMAGITSRASVRR